jgi:O-antigen/teichoic acid export membrane protein
MQFSELPGILYAVLYAAFIYLFVRKPAHILLVPYFALPINIFTLALSLAFLLRFFGNIKFFIDLKTLKENFLTSLPLSLLPILFYMSRNIEKLILGFYKSAEDFGYYSSAFRFIIILHAAVGIYYVAIFPILSRYYSQSLESFKRLTLYSAKFLFILSIPISFGGFILSKDLIVFIYGYKYIQSTASLQILIWSIIFIYISSILAQGLLAAGREMKIVMAYIIQLLITGALSFVFIPRLGTRAAATAVLLGEFAIFFFYYYEFNKIIKISLMKFFIKPLFAALVMAIVLRIYAGRNPILSLLIGIATYFLSLIVIKGFPWGEVDLILNAVINDKSKPPV